jgi:hypothetical protein
MKNSALLAVMLVTVALPVWGCAHKQDAVYVQPLSTYSSMDATALIYTDPAALAPTSDHPLRWLGFLGHPVGNLIDYLINRPLYSLAELSPSLFGYTSEDAMLESQRPPFR